MIDDKLWPLIDKVVGDYIPYVEENSNSSVSLDVSILSLLIKLRTQNLIVTNGENAGSQYNQLYDEVFVEIDQAIENNRIQFDEILESFKKTGQ
ncbi:hypothetical protein NC661_13295 [Aquibacillus koreensis]|uniref:Uncharacterized protein n=1 Tax=Aquibacillus koreensis TaxID=279446 RepID=A0A9X4AKE0_9BACI|nr:hypothetical protein [Aquibacillus koreensis]MCT2536304.1 hypothetical protein [Aquibacillus koreensis]MDC3421345.1 hypothetical protein [Aquibacillus koreensis]